MKRVYIATFAAVSFFVPEFAFAQSPASPAGSGLYVGVYAGAVFLDDNDFDITDLEYDTGYALGGKLGYRFGQIRVEGEFGYRAADAEFDEDLIIDEDVEYRAIQGSANAYFDIVELNLGGIGMTPYVGAGLGYVDVELDNDDLGDDDEDGLLLLGEAGFSVSLLPNVSIVPAYRYEYADIEVGEDDAFTSHSLQVGARFDF